MLSTGTKLNSTRRPPRSNPLLTTGFCVDSVGEEKLLAYGVERTWMGVEPAGVQAALDRHLAPVPAA